MTEGLQMPHSITAEREVLAAILVDPRCITAVAATGLSGSEFYSDRHRLVWDACFALWERDGTLDEVTIGEWMRDRGTWEPSGGMTTLMSLLERAGTTAHVHIYAETVRDKSRARRIAKAAQAIATAALTGLDDSVDDLASRAMSEIQVAATAGVGSVEDLGAVYELATAARSYEATLQTKHAPISLPTGGDGLTVVTARNGNGKTAWVFDAVISPVVKRGGVVAFASMEMDRRAICVRDLCHRTGYPYGAVSAALDGDYDFARTAAKHFDRDVLVDAMGQAREDFLGKLIVDESGIQSCVQVEALARKTLAERGRLDVVVVDHFHLMDHGAGRKSDRTDQLMARTSNRLRALQKELQCSVVVLVQLADSLVGVGEMPHRSHIRDCKQLAHDAGLMLGLVLREDATPNGAIGVLKNRNGRTGTFDAEYDGPSFTWEIV